MGGEGGIAFRGVLLNLVESPGNRAGRYRIELKEVCGDLDHDCGDYKDHHNARDLHDRG